MSKVTTKLQVTIPKAVADRFGIRPGDDIEWVAAGDALRVIPARTPRLSADEERRRRLELFDAATVRQQAREAGRPVDGDAPSERGWRREELYARGGPR